MEYVHLESTNLYLKEESEQTQSQRNINQVLPNFCFKIKQKRNIKHKKALPKFSHSLEKLQ